MRLIVILLGLLAFIDASAEELITISGKVTDANTGEELIGATITLISDPSVGAVTNVYGFYSLSLDPGEYNLRYTFLGYENKEIAINLTNATKLNVELKPAETELEEVVIESQRLDQNVKDIGMSRENLNVEQVKKLPALFGEVDVIRTLQLMPGIQSAGEGNTGLFVRGGNYDQNLILLDEAPVYNASHFLGFFSVFNADAIKNVEVYKGGIPSKYGGRLSSVIDISMKNGNDRSYKTSGGIGILSSRLTVEGPIQKERSSFIVTGRRTYADLFLRLSNDPNINNNTIFFYDLTAKANFDINENNKVFISGYFGRDELGIQDLIGFDWGNATGTLRWNHLFSDRFFSNTTFYISNFDYGFSFSDGTTGFDWNSDLQEYGLKFDNTFFINPNLTLDLGLHTILHRFSPAEISISGESFFEPFSLDNRFALQHGVYAGLDHKISDRLSFQYGLRYSAFQMIGPGKVLLYDENQEKSDDTIIDSLEFNTLETIRFYHGLEPRFGFRYLLTATSSIKASYNRTQQFLQVASNSAASFPTDLWIPADYYIRPLNADQVAMGYFRNFRDNMYETSFEVYYKYMRNLIDFKPNAQILLNNNIETEILSGNGYSYGAEYSLRKNRGQLTGMLSYTLSRTFRQIEGISNGDPYPARYDRIHDISLMANYELNKRMTFGAVWVYATGAAVSFPVGRVTLDDQVVAVYDDDNRNADRMPAYHRMDLSFTYELSSRGNFNHNLNISVYNVYNRKNAFSLEFRDIINNDVNYTSADGPVTSVRPGSVMTYLFPVLPSVTYNFNF